jgi:hypothetical protein
LLKIKFFSNSGQPGPIRYRKDGARDNKKALGLPVLFKRRGLYQSLRGTSLPGLFAGSPRFVQQLLAVEAFDA